MLRTMSHFSMMFLMPIINLDNICWGDDEYGLGKRPQEMVWATRM